MIPCTPFFWFEKPSNPGYQSTWGIWTCSFWTLIAKVHRLLHTLWRYAPVREKSQSLNLINLRGHLYQDAGKERKVIFQPQIDGKWKIVSLQDEFSLVRFPLNVHDIMGEKTVSSKHQNVHMTYRYTPENERLEPEVIKVWFRWWGPFQTGDLQVPLCESTWWFQPIWKILFDLDNFPK